MQNRGHGKIHTYPGVHQSGMVYLIFEDTPLGYIMNEFGDPVPSRLLMTVDSGGRLQTNVIYGHVFVVINLHAGTPYCANTGEGRDMTV